MQPTLSGTPYVIVPATMWDERDKVYWMWKLGMLSESGGESGGDSTPEAGPETYDTAVKEWGADDLSEVLKNQGVRMKPDEMAGLVTPDDDVGDE